MKFQNVNSTSTRHSWGDPKAFAADPAWSGCSRNERVCVKCGMTRITMIPPRGEQCWHEWLRPDGSKFQMEATPPCLGGQS